MPATKRSKSNISKTAAAKIQSGTGTTGTTTSTTTTVSSSMNKKKNVCEGNNNKKVEENATHVCRPCLNEAFTTAPIRYKTNKNEEENDEDIAVQEDPPYEEVEEVDDEEDDVDDEEEDEEDVEGCCLHCRKPKSTSKHDNTHVQVRCDECHAYICRECHWCHEFQANHEIRVCDRCDGFYCRNCDEMDQCDDCNEVVCGSCSTLLSCKFCGGGLCEECATACGRCGIVLCSRDAKFAVDCDTCRLSYCLVCLASGSKDPCVRCGHRPSKRMEQLVHLRLKSIYKAFKQNSKKNSHNASASEATAVVHDVLPACMEGAISGDSAANPEVLLQAAAVASAAKTSAAASKLARQHHQQHHSGTTEHHPSGANHNNNNISSKCHINSGSGSAQHLRKQLQNQQRNNTASTATAATTTPENASCTNSNNPNTTGRLHQRSESVGSTSTQEKINQFKAEKEAADAAAAALLAELEEEEEAFKSKKSKKKKKKEKQQQQLANNINDTKTENDDEHGSADKVKGNLVTRKLNQNLSHLVEDSALKEESDDDDIMIHPILPSTTEEAAISAAVKIIIEEDSLELELSDLVASEDSEGLERFLASIRGVPGRALLRKNAKKALKKIRLAHLPEDEDNNNDDYDGMMDDEDYEKAPTSRSDTPILQQNEFGGLLKVVSFSHNKTPTQPGYKRATSTTSGPLRSECVMHMEPRIVGWVIGKGGQRIRDLMEESGARIWIDQETMGSQEPRIVYISGTRKNVDVGVELVQELVAKAPPPTPYGSRHLATDSSPQLVSGPTSEKEAAQKSKVISGSVDRITSRNIGDNRLPATKKHVMTCEPRFVPLLIGRRGWTIKNIQDSCGGAKVDIDQTVNPRKITISGPAENVEKAIRMVNDVLSYPHAQLMDTEDEDVNEDIETPESPELPQMPIQNDSQQQVSNVSGLESSGAIVSSAAAHKAPSSQQAMFPPLNANQVSQSSPPSSLIMTTGDNKGTMSATSSLSSTPEPSMSSMPTMTYVPGPLIPPTHENRGMFDDGHNFSPSPQASQGNLGGPSFFPVHGDIPLPLAANDQYFGGLQEPGNFNHHIGHMLNQPTGTLAPSFPKFQQNTGGFGANPNSLPIPAQSTFPPVQTGFHHLQRSSSVPLNSMLNGFAEPDDSGLIAESPSAWNRPVVAPAVTSPLAGQHSQEPSDFRLDAAVEFLEHTKLADSIGLPNGNVGITESLGVVSPSHGRPLHREMSAPDPLMSRLSRDDAQIVDILFGPPDTSVPGPSIVTGLQGLAINNERAPASGLWEEHDLGSGLKGLSSLGGLGPESDSSLFYQGTQPSLTAKSQSRFAWGEPS